MFNKIILKTSFKFILLSFSISFSLITLAKTKVDLPQWQHHQLPDSPSLRGSAVNNNSLWVTGSNNSVFVSQDRGKTWLDKSVKLTENQNTNENKTTDFRDIELFNNNTAIVMGVGSGKQSRLYKTTNGGDNWQLLYQNTDEQGFFDSIAFWDENNGLLMGDPVDGYYVIKRTTDGGNTWQRIAKKQLPQIIENEAAFAASGNTLIVGEQGKAWLTTGGFSASVYTSIDYGKTWQRTSVPLYNKTQTAGGYGLAVNHLEQIFVVGGDYQQRNNTYPNMATLTNNQWKLVSSGQHGLRTAMSCQGKICIATGKNANDISYDGGKSWQVLNNLAAEENDKGFYTLASDGMASDGMLFLGAGHSGKVGILSFRK
ncbi:MAG: oxidoreductase [Alteromonadaceae bacterium]|nr:oxidoreductase [Alteromonadaceae bacterium]